MAAYIYTRSVARKQQERKRVCRSATAASRGKPSTCCQPWARRSGAEWAELHRHVCPSQGHTLLACGGAGWGKCHDNQLYWMHHSRGPFCFWPEMHNLLYDIMTIHSLHNKFVNFHSCTEQQLTFFPRSLSESLWKNSRIEKTNCFSIGANVLHQYNPGYYTVINQRYNRTHFENCSLLVSSNSIQTYCHSS